jgi:hypothetical protein
MNLLERIATMKFVNAHKQKWSAALIASAVVALVLVAISGMAATRRSAVNVTVTNNSQKTIVRLYVAVGDPDNWGPDQLAGASITTGGSKALSDVSCSGNGMRLIAEDQNGCFFYQNTTCDANQTWVISDAATPDCGG